jgi:hypothetical protein
MQKSASHRQAPLLHNRSARTFREAVINSVDADDTLRLQMMEGVGSILRGIDTKRLDLSRFGRRDDVRDPAAPFPRETLPSGWIEERIKSTIELFLVSSRLGVRPSTVRKILAGKPVSQIVQTKIDTALQGSAASNPVRIRCSSLERLLDVHRLYQKERTLQAVGERIGVSRERVRQLLVRGSKMGLFQYESFHHTQPFVSKQKILADYRRLLRLNRVAKANGLSRWILIKLIDLYGITQNDLKRIRFEGWKLQCIDEYKGYAAKLGHPPTTAELQKGSGRYLSHKITKLWGSFGAFRKELHNPGHLEGSSRSNQRER